MLVAPNSTLRNVLFLISDDFRPSSGAYGNEFARTPNLDRLASEGTLFTAAHVQFAYCAPSRNSFMSGRRPDATKAYNFLNHFRETGVGDQWVALPELFKNAGFLVTGANKLYHEGLPPNFDLPKSWSAEGPSGEDWPYVDSVHQDKFSCDHTNLSFVDDDRFCLTTPAPGKQLTDEGAAELVASRLTEAIDNWNATGQPFFVGLGTHKPHLVWEYPRHFFDSIASDVAEAAHQAWPAEVPHLGWHECAEMSHPYWDDNGWGVPPSTADFSGHQSLMRRAYYGCLMYTDHVFGRVLDVLEKSSAAARTATIFMGDHGWHLGEHDLWCKMTNRETGTRVPLIIRAPWLHAQRAGTAGGVARGLAEAVDLYPTLAELAGVALPTGAAGAYLGGTSLVPLLLDPTHGRVKDVVLAQFPRCWQNNTHHPSGSKPGDENNRTSSWETMSDCHWTERAYIDFMGYKMRTETMAITQWLVWDGAKLRPDWEKPVGLELYDHTGDTGMAPAAFDDFENVNLAGRPEYAQVQAQLLARLRKEVEKWMTPNPASSETLVEL